jgi:hypothetical protein
MKSVKLFEQFISEFYSTYDREEVTKANKFIAKETGLKNADSMRYPSLSVATLHNGTEIQVLFDKIVRDRPATEDNMTVQYIDATSVVRYITMMHPEEFKLMKQWAKKWGFKLDKSDQIYANKEISPKDTREMIEEFTNILVQVYGEDNVKLTR